MAGSALQFLSAIPSPASVGGWSWNWFNVTDITYGAVGDGTTNDTTAIQNAINAAHVSGGIVYLPQGTYSTNKLTFYGNVGIVGDGPRLTTLKSRAAEALLECVYTASVFVFPAVLQGFTLDGNSTGTIGMNLKGFDQFNWHDIEIHHFTTKGINVLGFLIGKITKFVIYNCPILVSSTVTSFSVDGGMQSNLVCFDNCTFQYGSTWGIQWDNAAGLKFRDCDFEHNGTALDYNTGSITFSSASPNNEGVGLVVDGCWFEQNHGICVYIPNPAGHTRTSIRDTIMQFGQTNTIGVKAVTTGSNRNDVHISGGAISGNLYDVFADGAMANVEYIAATITTPHLLNSGQIRTFAYLP